MLKTKFYANFVCRLHAYILLIIHVLLIHKFNFEFISIGFYRVNYDETNWNLLINYLESEDYEKIPPVNRAQLLDDALNLARAGVLNYSTALNLTEYLEKEVDYIPWYSALSAFSFLNLRLTGTEIYPAFKVIQGA
jgi:aminopeptidase N